MAYVLPETELMEVRATSDAPNHAQFVIEPLSPGYGVTIGNALRRVLLSSLEGSAITSVKIDGATHEFATLPGMTEDVVTLILNLKALRLQLQGSDPVTLELQAKGPGPVTAAAFKKNARVMIPDPSHYLATLDKGGKLTLEVTVERGRGYLPVEQRKNEQRPLGSIAVDAVFTPIKKVHYEVENTRVGGMTNFDKVILDLTTDETIEPRAAFAQAAVILNDHFSILTQVGEKAEVKGRDLLPEEAVTDAGAVPQAAPETEEA